MAKKAVENLQTNPETVEAISAVLTPKNIKSVLRKLLRIAKGLAVETIFLKNRKCPHCAKPILYWESKGNHDSMIKASKVIKDFSDKLVADKKPKKEEPQGQDEKVPLKDSLLEISEKKEAEKKLKGEKNDGKI